MNTADLPSEEERSALCMEGTRVDSHMCPVKEEEDEHGARKQVAFDTSSQALQPASFELPFPDLQLLVGKWSFELVS